MSRRQAQQLQKQQAQAAQVTMVDIVSLNLKETSNFPITVDVFMEDGRKEPLKIRKPKQGVELQLKLKLMESAPQLFYDNDPHRKYLNVQLLQNEKGKG